MNEDQLKTFLTIAQHKSYSKAALLLNVTQPTISSRIKSLEEILNCKLFNRVGHEIFLTKEGKLFVEYAESILIHMEHSKHIANFMKEPLIRVGFSPGYSYSFIIEILKAVKSIDRMNLQVIEGADSSSLNELALSGEVDLIFSRDILPNNQNITSEYLFDNNVVAVFPKNHPLLNKESLVLEDLNGETIISYGRKSALWKLINQKLIALKNITNIELDNSEMMMQAVINEIGIGITPKLSLDDRYISKVAVRKIKEIYNIPNKVYVHYRKNSQINSIAKKMIYTIINCRYDLAIE